VLPIVLDRTAPTSVSAQIAAAIREFIANGSLQAGEPVPSSRALAAGLGIARGTVVAAYDQLVAESYLVSKPGGKTTVHADAVAATPRNLTVRADLVGEKIPHSTQPTTRGGGENRTRPHRRQSETASIDLRPTTRRNRGVDDSAWREAWRSAAENQPIAPADTVQGFVSLLRAIAEHLRLMRSMLVDPDDIFITSGARDGLFQLLNSIDAGHSVRVGVEHPGYPGLRKVIEYAPAHAVQVPVDRHGILAQNLPDLDAVLVTPNHLYPSGGAMPAPRRLELLTRAAARGAIVIEDDLDSEYRHIGPVLPSLWELAPDTVAHLGTFSQVLTPDARIGYLIVPSALHEPLRQMRSELGISPSPIAQRAVAAYLESGGLRRQITKRRRDLVRRRNLAARALEPYGAQMYAGATALVELDSEVAARRVLERCLAHGVEVGDLAEYWRTPVHGIVLGYGDVPLEELERGLRVLADALYA
jgi:GntR family transcriptional regulator/MocR family aminotransferase